MELKEMLFRDFGKELPISGGFGQSPKDPIQVTALEPVEAAMTQLTVARCIYDVNGWYWRVLGRTRVETSSGRVEKLSSEVIFLEGDEIITEKRNFYFDISKVNLFEDQQLPDCMIQLSYPAKLELPWQLGWFHFDEIIDNEKISPGLGVSLAYSAPQAKLTVYAYDRGVSNSIAVNPDLAAKAEYLQAISDLELMNPGIQPVSEHEVSGARLKIYANGEILTAVLLAPFRKIFLKLRLTLNARNEPYMVNCAWTTIATFIALVGQAH